MGIAGFTYRCAGLKEEGKKEEIFFLAMSQIWIPSLVNGF